MTETTNDPSLLKTLVCLETTGRQNARRILSLQKEAINQIRAGFLQRQKHSLKELEDNRHQFLTQGTPSHKQNGKGANTPLVVTENQSHTEEMRRLGPLQNVR